MDLLITSFYLLESQPAPPQSPDWGMIGVVVTAFTAVVIGLPQIWMARKPRKSLKILAVSKVPLVQVDDRFKDELKVLFRDKEIRDATSIVLRIYNSGQVPITANDFDRPIAFKFSDDSTTINTRVVRTSPDNIFPQVHAQGNRIEIDPLLINRGDLIEFSTIVSSFDGSISVDGRIVDIKTIELEEDLEKNDSPIFRLIFMALYTIMSAMTVLLMGRSSDLITSLMILVISIGLLSSMTIALRKKIK